MLASCPRIGSGERSPEPIVRFDAHRMLALAFAGMLCAGTAGVNAGEIRIAGARCASQVALVARDARLSEVLGRLAKAYDFRLSFKSDTDPLINFSGSSDLARLVMQLSPQGNVSIATAPTPRCAHRERVATVWVLPDGPRTNVAQTTPAARARPAENAQAKVPDAPVDPLYLRSHGAALLGNGNKPR